MRRRTVLVCVTALLFTLLLLCGDVESNPGPDINENIKQSGGTNTRPVTRQTKLNMAAPVELTLGDIMTKLSTMDRSVSEKLDYVIEDV